MSLAQKFFQIAVNESSLPAFKNDPASSAHILCSGAIGQIAGPGVEGHIKAGLVFLDSFKETARHAVEDEMQNEAPKLDVISAIKVLASEVRDVDRDEYVLLLARDWDERQELSA